MEKIRLGKTNMMVSQLGLGTIPIQRLSTSAAIRIIQGCLDLGINLIDTANSYTTTEGYIGEAISGRRTEVILATKSMARTRGGIEEQLGLSLKRLGTEYIDLYQVHDIGDFETLEKILAPGSSVEVFEGAKRAGLVKHIGFSTHKLDVAKEAIKSDRFETVMVPFNCIMSEAADELLTLAQQHDVGFIAMKSLAGGRIDNIPIAFKYLLQFPNVVAIPGIKSLSEIEEIIKVAEGPHSFTQTEQQELKLMRDSMSTRFCRRCDYCQPCPESIPLSVVLHSQVLFKEYPVTELFTGRLGDAMAKAAECNKCGICEEKCPYNLPIRDMIMELIKWYEEERRKAGNSPP